MSYGPASPTKASAVTSGSSQRGVKSLGRRGWPGRRGGRRRSARAAPRGSARSPPRGPWPRRRRARTARPRRAPGRRRSSPAVRMRTGTATTPRSASAAASGWRPVGSAPRHDPPGIITTTGAEIGVRRQVREGRQAPGGSRGMPGRAVRRRPSRSTRRGRWRRRRARRRLGRPGSLPLHAGRPPVPDLVATACVQYRLDSLGVLLGPGRKRHGACTGAAWLVDERTSGRATSGRADGDEGRRHARADGRPDHLPGRLRLRRGLARLVGPRGAGVPRLAGGAGRG